MIAQSCNISYTINFRKHCTRHGNKFAASFVKDDAGQLKTETFLTFSNYLYVDSFKQLHKEARQRNQLSTRNTRKLELLAKYTYKRKQRKNTGCIRKT